MKLPKLSKGVGVPNTRLGSCSVCGNRADTGSPCISREEPDKVLCNECSKKDQSGRTLFGIMQWYDEDGSFIIDADNTLSLCYNGVECWINSVTYEVTELWVKSGQRVVFFSSEEKTMDPEILLRMIWAELKGDLHRCSRCSYKGLEHEFVEFNHAMFAGHLCPGCYEGWQKRVEYERRTGQICLQCGKPYLLCCC